MPKKETVFASFLSILEILEFLFNVNTYLESYSIDYRIEHKCARSGPRRTALSNYHPGERCWHLLHFVNITPVFSPHLWEHIKHCHLLGNERCPWCWKASLGNAWWMKLQYVWVQWVSYSGLIGWSFCPLLSFHIKQSTVVYGSQASLTEMYCWCVILKIAWQLIYCMCLLKYSLKTPFVIVFTQIYIYGITKEFDLNT